MTWYAAHVIVYVHFLDGNQDKIPLWENVLLIESKTVEEAHELAEKIGTKRYTGTDSSFTYEGRPAQQVFGGVRKLIECSLDFDAATRPFQERASGLPSGTEVTYSVMEVDSLESLKKLLDGEPVQVRYEE